MVRSRRRGLDAPAEISLESLLFEVPIAIWLGAGLALYMAWAIGANDVANAMGTSVGSGALTIPRAIIIAGGDLSIIAKETAIIFSLPGRIAAASTFAVGATVAISRIETITEAFIDEVVTLLKRYLMDSTPSPDLRKGAPQ